MNNAITRSVQVIPHSPTLEIMTPLASRALFWRARYLKNSPFLHHLPFLFWLVETCRPKSFVELGVGEGVSYFAACQAVDKLDLAACCQGIDRWEDKGASPDDVRVYNTEQYGDFSRLIAGDLREAVHRFPDGSIDLLHVDVEAGEGVLDSLSQDWTRKLSPRGVILLHGVATRFTEGPAKTFLGNLTANYPHVVLEGGEGLMAVLYGTERNERLAKLASLSFGTPGYAEMHQAFARLGATHDFEWSSRFEASEAENVREKLQTAEKLREDAESRSTRLEKKLESLNSAYDARTSQVAELQGKVFDFQSAHEPREAELASARAALEKSQKELASRDTALAEAHRKLEAQCAETGTEPYPVRGARDADQNARGQG